MYNYQWYDSYDLWFVTICRHVQMDTVPRVLAITTPLAMRPSVITVHNVSLGSPAEVE